MDGRAVAIGLMWVAVAAVAHIVARHNDSSISTPAWAVILVSTAALATAGVFSK